MKNDIEEMAKQCWSHYIDGVLIDGHLHFDTNKFAEMIIKECVAICMSQADKRNILARFGLPVESDVKYPGPEASGSVTSQYTREYNIPK